MIFQPQDHNDRLCSAKEDGHDDDSARAYAGRGVPLPELEEDDLAEIGQWEMDWDPTGCLPSDESEDEDAPPIAPGARCTRFEPEKVAEEPKP